MGKRVGLALATEQPKGKTPEKRGEKPPKNGEKTEGSDDAAKAEAPSAADG